MFALWCNVNFESGFLFFIFIILLQWKHTQINITTYGENVY